MTAAPEDLHRRALDLLMRGDTAGGISDLREYVGAEPDDEEAWLELGSAFAAIEHWPDAARALARAVELDGSVGEARLSYARALVRLGRLDDAAFQLLQAARGDAPDPRVLKELGIVFYDKRLYDKAVLWLGKACAAAPGDARARYALGLAEEARRDMGAAVAAYRQAVRLDGALTDARRTLVDALASMGEHESAIAELDALLGVERSSEPLAHNREVLVHALEAMRRHRLLGKTQKELEAAAVVVEGQLRRKGPLPATEGRGDALTVRYAGGLLELYAAFDAGHAIESLMLVLTDPERAASTAGDAFKVTVVGKDGRHEGADLATAATLTFLREALGCPMTQASALYARLLAGEARVTWGGAAAELASLPVAGTPEPLHGLRVSGRAR
jgi:tetratricopeptide (TPR) repeat protein